MTKRKAMTAKRRRAVAERWKWRTPTGAVLALEHGKVVLLATGKVPEIDHTHALSMGGTEAIENLRPMTVDEHKVKTRADAKVRAKVRRLTGANKPKTKRKIQSRGFDKTLRKRMDGTVERRT